VFRDGKAYGAVTVGKTRTMRLLYLADGKTACPADHDLAEDAMPRLRARIADEHAIDVGTRARLGEWLDQEYAAILRSQLSEHGADQAIAYLIRFADWCELAVGADAFMHQVQRRHAESFLADFLRGDVPAPPGHEERKPQKKRAYQPSYARRVINVLRRAWFDAAVRGFVTANPFSRLKLPRIIEKEVPWIEPADLERTFNAAVGVHGPRLRFLGWTGLCIGESQRLRRDQVDLVRARAFVPYGKTKNRTRVVPLTEEALAIVRALPVRDDGLLFEPRTANSVRDALQAALRHLGLPKLTTHQLRHVFSSHYTAGGGLPRDLAAILGHGDGGVLAQRRYARWSRPGSERVGLEQMRAFRADVGATAASPGTPAPPSIRSDRDRAPGAKPGPRRSRR
jgi:integrase